jgi:hypothetical protein
MWGCHLGPITENTTKNLKRSDQSMNGGVQMQKWKVDNILQVSWTLHETMN